MLAGSFVILPGAFADDEYVEPTEIVCDDGYVLMINRCVSTLSPPELEYFNGFGGMGVSGYGGDDLNYHMQINKAVYSWTEAVQIGIYSADHNTNSSKIETIGDDDQSQVTISTRNADIDYYKLVETGPDTGLFVGNVTLTGFLHDADGKSRTGDANGYDTNPRTSPNGSGPFDGFLESDDEDGLTLTFKESDGNTIVLGAEILWNIADIHWVATEDNPLRIYDYGKNATIRVIDMDMNLDPLISDSIEIDVWSETDYGGINLFLNETSRDSGIFEGRMGFTDQNSEDYVMLKALHGDEIYAEYEDSTLPDPYTHADELDIERKIVFGQHTPMDSGLFTDKDVGKIDTMMEKWKKQISKLDAKLDEKEIKLESALNDNKTKVANRLAAEISSGRSLELFYEMLIQTARHEIWNNESLYDK